jgi:chromosome segregation ATPase
VATLEEIRSVVREELAKLEEKLEQKLEEKLEQKLEEKLEQKLQPLWKALGSVRTTFGERLDRMDLRLERMESFTIDQHVQTRSSIGALKESIDARDFRLDEHGRRLTSIENDVADIKGQLPR